MATRDPLDRMPDEARARLRKIAQPAWIAPMLATLTEERFSRAGWLFERKWDGERCLAFRNGRALNLFSRNGKRLNDKYPEIVLALQRQETSSFIADGEVVAVSGGAGRFAELQRRMQVEHPPPELVRMVPVRLYLFDLLYLGSYDTRQVALKHRKEALRFAFDFGEALRFTEYREREGEAYYRLACASGWEGVVAKNGASVYVSRRTRDWLKFKCSREQEFVIGGYTEAQGSRIGFGALLVGFYRGGKLVYAGKVGTGFDVETLQRLGQQLARLEIPNCPFAGETLPRRGVHFVKPKLVAQIGFTEWTSRDKLRHPRFLGLREDKNPEQVVREG